MKKEGKKRITPKVQIMFFFIHFFTVLLYRLLFFLAHRVLDWLWLIHKLWVENSIRCLYICDNIARQYDDWMLKINKKKTNDIIDSFIHSFFTFISCGDYRFGLLFWQNKKMILLLLGIWVIFKHEKQLPTIYTKIKMKRRFIRSIN